MVEHARKGYTTGTHRLISPRDTMERLRPLLPRMGITRLANVTGLDHIGIPVVMACRPNSRSLAVSQGKGMDLDSAKVSAAMESIETYHAEHVELPLQFATYREMQTRRTVVDVDLLPRAPESPFHVNRPILWVEGENWLGHEKIWVPYQMVHTAYTNEWSFDLKCFLANSTGLASGNHILEAASHAICEAVERDASKRWEGASEEDRAARRVDLATVEDALSQEALHRFDRAGVSVAVWDITSPVGMPVFECLIAERQPNSIRPVCAAGGFGCHPSREIALLRALTEAAQSRLTAISGSRDDMPRDDYQRWLDPETLEMQRKRACAPGSWPFSAAPTFCSDSFEADVQWELERVREGGFSQVIVTDLTREEFELPVVRVLIPGMEMTTTGNPDVPASRGRLATEGLA